LCSNWEIISKQEEFTSKYKMFLFDRFDLARKNEKIIGITPAMPSGSSLKFMMDAFPKRAFDVGNAEQHAALAAGMATQGMCLLQHLLYFSTKAYDQIIHDVASRNFFVWTELD
jgi:1-deoxy-D-xylulose-5-phosphate synthase